MPMQKQGIVTILGSDCDIKTSLPRTLSADMSSKKWLSQNNLPPIKKTASSEQLSHSKLTSEYSFSSSEGEEDERERFQIWSSIQGEKKEQNKKPEQFDVWSSILTQKANDEASKLSAPYIHPLVKRSKSCLSEKSLEICTESLGSETGSDGFSSYPPSETEDSEDDEKEKVRVQAFGDDDEEEKELKFPKYNCSVKKSLPRCFPPPLPSLSSQHGGASLHMKPHRDNGRLFLQAVSVPSQNNFLAQRQDGRLVLTFASEDQEEEKDHVDEAEEDETVMEQAPMLSTSVPRLALNLMMMVKPIGLVNIAKRGFFNAYDQYYWRTKLMASDAPVSNNSITRQQNDYLSLMMNNISSKVVVSGNMNTNQASKDSQKLLVVRGKSCKDSRMSFLFWEPYCIAT